ncbi:MAG: DUF1343 domain-containing protein [Elusimicrobia bacterium]|nr:DUF1343 domain-containing protein [Elusimicrobiota bacterium]
MNALLAPGVPGASVPPPSRLACGLLAALALAIAPQACRAEVRTGIDVLEDAGFAELQGKRVGLITNQTGKDASGRTTVDVLANAPGVTLAKLFSPEHGFYGMSEEHVVSSSTLLIRGREVPIVSLYSGGLQGMRPKPSDLAGLDVLVFDIQDIGARFYTYLATMGMALEEAAKAKLPFVVLDRPNPINGLTVEGPILTDLGLRQVTSTAYYPVPVRHGLTAAEVAMLYNTELHHPGLSVVKMKNWQRRLWYDETGLPWTPPSPNMPDLDAATLYPGIGCFEASNISVGRGTPFPFRWIGAPWMRSAQMLRRLKKAGLAGIVFEELAYTPAKSVFTGNRCGGIRMTITDREKLRPLEVFAHLAAALRDLNPEFTWKWEEARRMVGTDSFRQLYESSATAKGFIRLFNAGEKDFRKTHRLIRLY